MLHPLRHISHTMLCLYHGGGVLKWSSGCGKVSDRAERSRGSALHRSCNETDMCVMEQTCMELGMWSGSCKWWAGISRHWVLMQQNRGNQY